MEIEKAKLSFPVGPVFIRRGNTPDTRNFENYIADGNHRFLNNDVNIDKKSEHFAGQSSLKISEFGYFVERKVKVIVD